MKVGVATWPDLGSIDEPVLMIVNARETDRAGADTLFEELGRHVPASAIHLIAQETWRDWAGARGIAGARALFHERALEVNYFLTKPHVARWIASRPCRVIVGSLPHNLYNEEVQDVFERRVTLLLGDGRFLAHALPRPYLYVLDAPALVRRVSRSAEAAAYIAATNGIVAELHSRWLAQGSPAIDDDPDFADARAVLARHLGGAVLSYDEASRIPIRRADISAPVAAMVSEVRESLIDAATRIDEFADEAKHPVVTRLRRLLGRGQRLTREGAAGE